MTNVAATSERTGQMRAALRGVAARVAAGAPVRVFVLTGLDAPGDAEDLRLSEHVRVVDSPRSAIVLLIAGTLPAKLHEAALRIHDAMSHPRQVVWWGFESAGAFDPTPFPNAVVIGVQDDVIATLIRVQREVLRGERSSTAAVLPDVDPAQWRGAGPYGQGGSGMTGGVPYGRPMAERAPDRDGLELDQLPLRIGPFFPAFPTGLALDVKLQGDVVQDVLLAPNPFDGGSPPDARDLFRLALEQPVRVVDLELTRAAHHLRWLAHALRVAGLSSLGLRALALAASIGTKSPRGLLDEVRALRKLLERTRAFVWATRGIGRLICDDLAGRGLGPAARACGLAEDLRADDATYRSLDFTTVIQRTGEAGGDACARWRQRIDEVVQALTIAGRAGALRVGSADRIEGPRGVVTRNGSPLEAMLRLVPQLLRGADWGDAVTTIVSLDLDLAEGAHHAALDLEPNEPQNGHNGGRA